MAIEDVEGIYYHDGDLVVNVVLELMYLLCESPKDKARDTAKSRPSM